MRLSIEIPDNSLNREEQEEFEHKMKIDAAIELFQKGRVSSGYAAKMIGMTKRDFMELLRERGIPFVNMTEEELKKEWEGVDKMAEQLKKESLGNV